jgi:hypothetical protein
MLKMTMWVQMNKNWNKIFKYGDQLPCLLYTTIKRDSLGLGRVGQSRAKFAPKPAGPKWTIAKNTSTNAIVHGLVITYRIAWVYVNVNLVTDLVRKYGIRAF